MEQELRDATKKALSKRSVSQLLQKLKHPETSAMDKEIIEEILTARGWKEDVEEVKEENAKDKANQKRRDPKLLPIPKLPSRKMNFNFEYRFTAEELRDKASQLAQACQEKKEIDDERKSVASQFKSKLDSKEAEINLLSRAVSTGKDWMTKTCDCIYDHERGIKTYFNNGVEVGQEKMISADYQLQAEL